MIVYAQEKKVANEVEEERERYQNTIWLPSGLHFNQKCNNKWNNKFNESSINYGTRNATNISFVKFVFRKFNLYDLWTFLSCLFSFNCFANILWHWDRLCYCQRKVCILCKWFSMTHSSLTLTFYITRVSNLFHCNPFSKTIWKKIVVLIHVLNCTIPNTVLCWVYHAQTHCMHKQRIHNCIVSIWIIHYKLNQLCTYKPKTHPNAIELGAKSSQYTIAAPFLSTTSVFVSNIIRCGLCQSISQIADCRV